MQSPHAKPTLLLTMGDPAGIGPEICVKAFQRPEVHAAGRLVLIASTAIMQYYVNRLAPHLTLRPIASPCEAPGAWGTIDILPTGDASPGAVPAGRISAAAGRAAEQCILRSIELALQHEADAVVTAPINKEALVASGSKYIDHTEMFAEMTESRAMTMFEVDTLRIFFVTRHQSLQDSIRHLDRERIREAIIAAHKSLLRLGFVAPRMAVAALNPHAGEGGLFGDDETRVITPAIADAKSAGVDVAGPVPADAVFSRALHGAYDAVISLYHDQGHIAAKTYDFDRTVSVTLGLPFIRTSVDHGTAFDIAGRGIANDTSLAEAIKCAARYALKWKATAGLSRP